MKWRDGLAIQRGEIEESCPGSASDSIVHIGASSQVSLPIHTSIVTTVGGAGRCTHRSTTCGGCSAGENGLGIGARLQAVRHPPMIAFSPSIYDHPSSLTSIVARYVNLVGSSRGHKSVTE